MKYLAAYALLTLSGKKDITVNDIKGVLKTVESNADDNDIKRVIESLKGKKVHELIAQGTAKIGGSAPVATATGAVAAKKEQPKKKQQPKKKKQQPKKEDSEEEGMGGLFD